MDLDELFGDGAELGKDVVVKAQLRFRVHPPKHPVAQDLVDRLVTAYDERLDLICKEVEDIVQHADHRRADAPLLVLALKNEPMQKAVQQPYQPGARGGKWYRDGQGHIRYGEKPQATFKQKAQPHDLAPHVGHYRPGPFMGLHGSDRDLTGYLMQNGGDHGFTGGELRFLGSWYGTDTGGGALFDAFLDCAGLTREDLKDGTVHLRFGPSKLTYEEAVFEFFAAQSELFIGKEATSGGPLEKWHMVLNDEIKPMLDSVFGKYEALKTDEKFQEKYTQETRKQQDRFFDNARRHVKDTNDLANRILGDWNPSKMAAEVISGMQALGLFAKKTHVNAKAKHHDRPHLKGAVALDERLFVDNPERSPLLTARDKLGKLSASQLMLLYAAAELHRRWDPDSRSYSDEDQADVGSGHVGEAILSALADKSEQWQQAIGLVMKHLDQMVDRLVSVLNKANSGPQKKARK